MAPSRAALTYLAASLARLPSPQSHYAASWVPIRDRYRSRCLSRPPIATPIRFSPVSIRHGRLYSVDATAVGGAAADDDGGPQPPDYMSEGERGVFEKLKRELEPVELKVQDVSGGCGSMYAIDVVSKRFKGLSMVRQHRLVNQVLEEEIARWHGVQLKTRAA